MDFWLGICDLKQNPLEKIQIGRLGLGLGVILDDKVPIHTFH